MEGMLYRIEIEYLKEIRYLLLGGKKGHISMLEWQSKKLECEIFVNETVRDVK
jgi:U3 small nucleolar RNA-associated protein 7